MSDVTVYDLIQKSSKNESVKKQQNKIDTLKLQAKKIESVELDENDKKDILKLKDQWNELILDTEKLRTQYEMLIKDIEKTKEIEIDLERGNSWKHKFARWLIR